MEPIKFNYNRNKPRGEPLWQIQKVKGRMKVDTSCILYWCEQAL